MGKFWWACGSLLTQACGTTRDRHVAECFCLGRAPRVRSSAAPEKKSKVRRDWRQADVACVCVSVCVWESLMGARAAV